MNNKRPLVSVITTTYNKFEFLYDTLDSIFIQDYPNIEIVIGDDGSTNFPLEGIKNYISEHKGSNITNVIILHEEENRGTVWNCNNCRKKSSGEFIMGLASDDRFYDKRVVSDLVDRFVKTNSDIIVCKRQFVDYATDKELFCMPFSRQIKFLKCHDHQKLFEEMCSFPFISGANTYYKRSAYEKMGGYNCRYKYIEDVPFYLKSIRNRLDLYFYDRVTIKYRYGAGISTVARKNNSFNKAMYNDRIRYIKEEIVPYMAKFPFWRKEQIKVRLRRFCIERSDTDKSLLRIYLGLFLYSPIGCIVHVWYQMSFKIRVKIFMLL